MHQSRQYLQDTEIRIDRQKDLVGRVSDGGVLSETITGTVSSKRTEMRESRDECENHLLSYVEF